MWVLFGRIGMKKSWEMITLVLLIVFVLNACAYSTTHKWKVCNQANTKWVSEDESVIFSVNDNFQATGLININGECVEIYMTEGPVRSKEMHIYPIEVLEYGTISEKDKYEYWICSYESEGKFVATVKKTTFFEAGKQLVFYRTQDIS